MICAKPPLLAATSSMILISPPAPKAISYARYMVRVEEMRQSVKIIQQALDKLPFGPVRSNNRKYRAAAAL